MRVTVDRQIITADETTSERELSAYAERALAEGRYADAARAYALLFAALTEESRRPSTLFSLGRAYEGMGERPRARDAYRALAHQAPESPYARAALTRLIELHGYLEEWPELEGAGAQLLARSDLEVLDQVLGLGARALRGRSPLELAFMAGKHLAWYREERFVRLLVPSIADLEDLFLAALHIGNPGIPLSAEVKRRVLPLAQAIEPILEPLHVDRLRGYFLRFVEDGGRTNLQRWALSAERTAARAGLLLAGDLAAAEAVLRAESGKDVDERMNDLLVYITSDRYAALRKQLGIAHTA